MEHVATGHRGSYRRRNGFSLVVLTCLALVSLRSAAAPEKDSLILCVVHDSGRVECRWAKEFFAHVRQLEGKLAIKLEELLKALNPDWRPDEENTMYTCAHGTMHTTDVSAPLLLVRETDSDSVRSEFAKMVETCKKDLSSFFASDTSPPIPGAAHDSWNTAINNTKAEAEEGFNRCDSQVDNAPYSGSAIQTGAVLAWEVGTGVRIVAAAVVNLFRAASAHPLAS